MSTPHWHVLGAGAIGCLLASKLHAAGSGVTLLLREPSTSMQVALTVDSAEGGTRQMLEAAAVREAGTVTHLLVTTKATQILPALQQVAPHLADGVQVVLAANGLGYLAQTVDMLPQAEFFCCSTTEGAFRIAPFHIRHAGRGRTLFGRPGGGPATDWFGDWQRSDLDCEWRDPVEPALWHKLAINCAINPLTAVHHCRNGELVERPELQRQLERLCDEIAAVSREAGYRETANTLHRDVLQVARDTANNRSSMLQDVEAGRTTEIDYINGHLLDMARRLGLQAPHNEIVFQQVKDLTAGV